MTIGTRYMYHNIQNMCRDTMPLTLTLTLIQAASK